MSRYQPLPPLGKGQSRVVSYYFVEPPRRVRVARRLGLIAIVAVVAGALLASYALARPVVITVDGVKREVPAGAVVADLESARVFKASAGDLIAVDGSIARRGGGAPARILRNGQPANPAERLYRGDVLVSRRGADVPESLEETRLPIAYETRVEGKGSLSEVVRAGRPGEQLVKRGAVSHLIVDSVVLAEPVDEIVRRFGPKPGMKLVALTFDDGPWPGHTARVLDELKKANVKATFFLLGGQVKRYPGLVRRIVAEGHLLASHSLGHRYFSKIDAGQIRREVNGGRNAIKTASGVTTNWIRPPYGAMDGEAWRVVRASGGRVVLWDVDSGDWRKPGAKVIANTVVKHTTPGSIVLMHDGGGDRKQTAAAIPIIAKKLRAKGYVFVTVEELVRAKGVTKAPAARAAAGNRPK